MRFVGVASLRQLRISSTKSSGISSLLPTTSQVVFRETNFRSAHIRPRVPAASCCIPRYSRGFTTSLLNQQQEKADDAGAGAGIEEEMRRRREWVARFEDQKLRREDFQVTFSRSSGPGGQNVNKLNTKANIRLDLSQAGSHAPESLPASHPKKWLTRDLVGKIAKHSPYYVASDHTLLVTSMKNRTQEANVEDALQKMHAHILELAQDGLVGETSEEQKRRVKRLQEADARRKKQNKIKRADVKSGRKFKG